MGKYEWAKLDSALKSVNNLKGSIGDLIERKREADIIEEEKKNNTLVIVLSVVGAVAVIALLVYAVYRYFTPDYLEDFDDEYDDRFDDDFFDDEDIDDESAGEGEESKKDGSSEEKEN
ncbi:MAG: DUF4366 domain-containing protein [Lachnospiraceae bacterium]|nr:DUF4366 domain-containing protein [Lachnospiraceae bacterium]